MAVDCQSLVGPQPASYRDTIAPGVAAQPSPRCALFMKLLVIEDHSALVANLFDYLEPRGHVLDVAPDGVTGLHLATVNDYDALIVDWMLPRLDGKSLIERLRMQVHKETPILMLTARSEIEDKVTALHAGADDYLTKPFAMAELEARLAALVRRSTRGASAGRLLRVADLELDLDTLQIQRGERVIHLYPACRTLLETLLRASPAVVGRPHLEHVLWGDHPPAGDQLRGQIHVLRRAIDEPHTIKLLHTVARVGYRLAGPDGADT